MGAKDKNMATDLTPVVTTTVVGEPVVEPTKVTFTAEQQDKIQQLINAAVARTASTQTTAHAERVAALQAEVEAAKAAAKTTPSGTTVTDAEAKLAEYKSVVEAAKAETERFKQDAVTRQAEVLSARSEAQQIRKEVAITEAAAKIPFFNLELVKQVTKDSVVFDAELGKFVVKGPNGQTRYDSTLENPLSLDAFYAEYASNNKYLVRSTAVGGTGSSEASRTDVATGGRFAVTDIFGPKSSSMKASQLMRENPQEYQRLKQIARTEHLIA